MPYSLQTEMLLKLVWRRVLRVPKGREQLLSSQELKLRQLRQRARVLESAKAVNVTSKLLVKALKLKNN